MAGSAGSGERMTDSKTSDTRMFRPLDVFPKLENCHQSAEFMIYQYSVWPIDPKRCRLSPEARVLI